MMAASSSSERAVWIKTGKGRLHRLRRLAPATIKDRHSRRDTRRGRLIRVGPNLAQNGKRLRRSGARHLCCRVQNGRGRGAGDFDSSHRVRGDPAFPRTHALRAVCAGFEQALTLPDLQDVEGPSSDDRPMGCDRRFEILTAPLGEGAA